MTEKFSAKEGETRRALALGNFDGLHIGHTAVTGAACEAAKRLSAKATALIFSEHPMKILCGSAPPLLLDTNLRDELLRKAGLEIKSLDFRELKDMSPEEFFERIIIDEMRAAAVVCGFNYSFGRGGAGNPKLLRELCESKKIEFIQVPAANFEGRAVSSSRIRECIEKGDIERANLMLGRPFRYRLPVTGGGKRGRRLEAPTVNQRLPEGFVRPRFGVYMSRCIRDGITYNSVTNVGVRPTVGTEELFSETHILDFDGDLYGSELEVELLRFLRPERKFPNFELLKAQISKDIEEVRRLTETA